MDAATSSQLEELQAVRDAHQRRRKILRTMVARAGREASPADISELDELQGIIATIDDQIAKLIAAQMREEQRQVSAIVNGAPVADLIDLGQRLARIWSHLERMEDDLRRQLAGVYTQINAMQDQVDAMQNADRDERQERQRQLDGQIRRVFYAIVGLSILFGLDLVIRVFFQL